jgi:hypothetical protein
LQAGRYEIAVSDKSSRAGFFVTRHGADTLGITSLPFTGKHARLVTLVAGQWSFYSRVGRPTPFLVVTA